MQLESHAGCRRIIQNRRARPIQGSFADWVFCVHMYNAALLSILRLYVYQYPMSLFPINLIRKWGWKMPIGVFVDECSGGIIEEALGKHQADKLREILLKDQEVSEKLQHANSFPALTDDAIWETWHTSSDKRDGLQCPKDIPSMAAQLKGLVRSTAWAFNCSCHNWTWRNEHDRRREVPAGVLRRVGEKGLRCRQGPRKVAACRIPPARE